MCVGGVSVCGREAERGCVFVGLCCGHLLNDGTTGSALKTTSFCEINCNCKCCFNWRFH